MPRDRKHPPEVQLLNYSMEMAVDDRIRSHIQQCSACRKRIEQFEQERASFDAFVQPEKSLDRFLERHQAGGGKRPSRWFRLAPVAGVFLLLLTLLAGWQWLRQDSVRLKGSVSVQVYVKRDAEVLQAGDDFRFRKGDRLRLGVLSPRKAWVTVLAEQSGRMEPIPKLTDVAVPAGQETVLPGSLQVGCESDQEVLQLRLHRSSAARGEGDAGFFSKTIHLECERP
jgi:hypothetical protein